MERRPGSADPAAMRARLLLSLSLLALAGVAPPARAAVVGISDQNASAFADARLRGLGLAHARLVVPYDAATSEPARVQAWLDAAAAAGLAPHVAFEHARGTRCPAFPCSAPGRAAYAQAVRRFVARFPQVRTYTTWNEANHVSQPVAGRPEAVAGYYEELRAACPRCTVVAGDVLDSGSYVGWLRRFRAATRSAPRLWGLHNYSDVTYGRTTGTDAVLAAVPGRLWIEETGGIVTLRNGAGLVTLPTDEARAASAIARAFAIARSRPRIGRMYVYQWQAGAQDRFDAGLVRLRASGTAAWATRRLAARVYATTAGRRTATLTLPVATSTRRRARAAARRRVALSVRPSAPAAAASTVTLVLGRPR